MKSYQHETYYGPSTPLRSGFSDYSPSKLKKIVLGTVALGLGVFVVSVASTGSSVEPLATNLHVEKEAIKDQKEANKNRVEFCLQKFCNQAMAGLGMNFMDPLSGKTLGCLGSCGGDVDKAQQCIKQGGDSKQMKALDLCAVCNKCLPGEATKEECKSVPSGWGPPAGQGSAGGQQGGDWSKYIPSAGGDASGAGGDWSKYIPSSGASQPTMFASAPPGNPYWPPQGASDGNAGANPWWPPQGGGGFWPPSGGAVGPGGGGDWSKYIPSGVGGATVQGGDWSKYIPSSAAGSGSGSGGDWTKYIPDSAGGAAADGAAKGKRAADEGQAKESQGVTKGVQEQEKHTHPDHSI